VQQAELLGSLLPTPEQTTKGLTGPIKTRGKTCLPWTPNGLRRDYGRFIVTEEWKDAIRALRAAAVAADCGPKATPNLQAEQLLSLLESKMTERPDKPRKSPGSAAGKGNGGRRPLEESTKPEDKWKSNIYTFIQSQKAAGKNRATILAELKASNDWKKQAEKAGLSLDKKMVNAALALPGQRKRDQGRKKQETPSN